MATPIDELKILVTAEVAKAISDLDKTEKKTNQTASAFAKLRDVMQGPVAAGQAMARTFGQVWAKMDKMIMAAAESDRAVSNLNSVLKSTQGIAGLTSTELLDLASSMAKTTLLEDDLVVQSEAVLLTFKRIGKEVFPDAIRAAADMAQVMGMDLQSATLAVGKALNEPVQGMMALRRMGVQLTDTQEEQVKQFMAVNDIASAQGVIMGELKSQFGGAAQAAAASATGGFAQLKKSMGELEEAMGKVLAVNLSPIAQAYKNVILDPLTQALDDKVKRMGFGQAIKAGLTETTINVGEIKRNLDALGLDYREFITYVKEAEDEARQALAGATNKKDIAELEAMIAKMVALRVKTSDMARREEALAKQRAEAAAKEAEAARKKAEADKKAEEALILNIELTESLRRANLALFDGEEVWLQAQKDANDERAKSYQAALDAMMAGEDAWIQYQIDKASELTEIQKQQIDYMKQFGEALGEALVTGEDGWKAFGKAGLDAVAAIIEGQALAWAQEAIAFFAAGNIASGVGMSAAAIGGYTAAGAIRAIPMAEGGMGTVTKPTLFLAGEAGPEDFAFGPKRKGGLSGMTIIQNIGGSVIAEKQLESMAVGAVRKASRGY